jgi:eukaryotic-like serine/threonine-protein kinase
MTAPLKTEPPVEQFVQALLRCGLFSRDEVKRMLKAVPASQRKSSVSIAEAMIDQKHLTQFQARKLLKGTWQGLVLGHFRVMAPLGKGGMGAVYLAQMQGNEERKPRLVALKILPPKKAKQSMHLIPRFQREMELALRMDHPHLTRTYDTGEVMGVHYIAMEYIRGQSLSQLVRGSGPLNVARAAKLFSEVAAGLTYAHEQNVIHRDLKPSNIMITPKDHAKILDLGLALAQDLDLPDDKQITGGEGYVVGTMDYISPEQVQDSASVDHRADLYSLGCTLFFALAGFPPFGGGGTSIEKMKRHLRAEPPFLSDINPLVPVEFSRIIEKLLAKIPSRRYPDAQSVRQALLPWADEEASRELEQPDTTDSQMLIDLEKANADQEGNWESVQIVPLSTSKVAPPAEPLSSVILDDLEIDENESEDELDTPRERRRPRARRRKANLDDADWIPYLVWGLIVCVGGITLIVIISRILRNS